MADPTADGMVQVSAAELRQQRELLSLFDKVWNSADVGEQVRRKAKEINPALVIPDEHPVAVKAMRELDAAKGQITALETAFNDYKQAGETRAAETQLRAKLGNVQDKFGFTDEAMANVVKIMQDRQLADPEAAALLYRESIPKAAPVPASNPIFDTKMNLFGTQSVDESWRKLHEDQDGFFADVVNQVFTEMPATA